MKNKKMFTIFRLIAYILNIFFILLIKNELISFKCFWKENYNILCPSCGITRAMVNISKLNIQKAISYNMFFTCVLFPIAMIFMINDIYVILKRTIINKPEKSFVEILFKIH